MAELQQRMSSREFSQWMAFSRLEPFGDERADLRNGIIAATIANTNLKKGQKPYTPLDFIPRFSNKPKQSSADQLALIEQLNEAFGGEDLRKKPENSTDK